MGLLGDIYSALDVIHSWRGVAGNLPGEKLSGFINLRRRDLIDFPKV